MPYRIKLITGPEISGKTLLTKNIMFGYDKPIMLNCRSQADIENPFLFSEVTEDTDLIVFDDVPLKLVKSLIYMCYGRIYINKRGDDSFMIYAPRVIINTVGFDKEFIGKSILRRIHVIKTFIDTNDGKLTFKVLQDA